MNPMPEKQPESQPAQVPVDPSGVVLATVPQPPREIGGREGPEPTRFGDWEKAGRCIDF
jgi:hypothetical protein